MKTFLFSCFGADNNASIILSWFRNFCNENSKGKDGKIIRDICAIADPSTRVSNNWTGCVKDPKPRDTKTSR